MQLPKAFDGVFLKRLLSDLEPLLVETIKLFLVRLSSGAPLTSSLSEMMADAIVTSRDASSSPEVTAKDMVKLLRQVTKSMKDKLPTEPETPAEQPKPSGGPKRSKR